jgi:hypothetical protein
MKELAIRMHSRGISLESIAGSVRQPKYVVQRWLAAHQVTQDAKRSHVASLAHGEDGDELRAVQALLSASRVQCACGKKDGYHACQCRRCRIWHVCCDGCGTFAGVVRRAVACCR